MPLSVTPIRILPVNKRLRNLIENNLLPTLHLSTQNEFLEKLVESLLYNFYHEHILLKLKIKMLLRKIISKNLTAEVKYRLQINFRNSLDPDQALQNVGHNMRLIKFHAHPCFQLIEIKYKHLFLYITLISSILSQHGEIVQDFYNICTRTGNKII